MIPLLLWLVIPLSPQADAGSSKAKDAVPASAEKQGEVAGPRSAPRSEADSEAAAAGRVAGIEFTDEELELLRGDVAGNRESYRRLREFSLENAEAPALIFDPALLLGMPRIEEPC